MQDCSCWLSFVPRLGFMLQLSGFHFHCTGGHDIAYGKCVVGPLEALIYGS